MKNRIALVLAVALLIALFAGCGGAKDGSTPANNKPAETASPYHYAKGNFKTDDRGIAMEKYDYQLPFCETDETLTFWTVCWNPEYIPEEGFTSMEFPQEMKKLTGVNMEYTIVTQDAMKSNFATLVAADDMRDLMMHGASYYSGTVKEAVDDGYFINIYDYRDYCPNYMYESVYRDAADKATYSSVFYEDDFVYSFWDLYDGPVVNMGPVIRADWAESLGYNRETIRTWDEVFDMMTAMKSQGYSTAPWQIMNTIEISGAQVFASFDTVGYMNTSAFQAPFQIDNKVQMIHLTEGDHELISYLNKCWNAGLIDPDWAGASSNNDYLDKVDNMGFFATTASGIMTLEQNCSDPNAVFATIHKVQRSADQTFHVGLAASRKSYGETSISAKGSNIELAVTWCDFRYSKGGYALINYGKQGYTWDYDENGGVRLTDQVLKNPQGLASTWCLLLYAFNNLADCGLEDPNRKLYYPGGEKYIEYNEIWYDYKYDGEWEWPFGLNLSDEDQQKVNDYAGDLVTYITENYVAFVDNSKPMSEWNAYVSGGMDIGGTAIAEIYQSTLDAYNKQ